MKKEIVDIRYVAKILFLMCASFNLGHTFGMTWLGILFTVYFGVIGFLNGTKRRDFQKRPKYKKSLAYGAILPLALYWVITPGVENGVNPLMIFLPGLYLLFLTALQERSRGNGGFEVFVAFDGMASLLFSLYSIPKGWAPVGLAGLLLALFAYSRRGTSWYKYLFFVLLIAILGGISYGGWRYWRAHHFGGGERMAQDYYQRERIMGFDPVAALGSFSSNYDGRYNDQVVLRVWDTLAPKYFKAASYEKYVAGIWKLPANPARTLTPDYYQVDYAVFETSDSVTRSANNSLRQIWVQSTLENFGFLFAPYGAVGYAVKDVDSLQYFSGGMVSGLDGNGKRSDWHYFVCDSCSLPDSLTAYTERDLLVGRQYESLMDTVVSAMGLVPKGSDSIHDDSENLQRILAYFKDNFTYSLRVQKVVRKSIGEKRFLEDRLRVFWNTRQGFCEYYASLSTLALRSVGIPARYVTGFVNPQVVEGRPYAVFRRRNSHAWVEAFVDGRWVIFDPTPPAMIPEEIEPNWFSDKWEGVRGRFARLMHFLKEGEWRRTVDGWQSYTQKFLDSGILYALLGFLVALFTLFKIREVLKNRVKNVICTSENAERWIKELDKAERELNRYGFHRGSGETVSSFTKRVQTLAVQRNRANPKSQDQNEKHNGQQKRHILELLKVLQEYENHRWRK
ncbi:MAG: transglutaminase domain-containing protein [Fibrobacter sp.]|nr:transglutaminase domain-containing protein [Fibrobacter sp.]